MSSDRDYPALNRYLERSGGKFGKRRNIYPQPLIALPAEGIKSGDQYLHSADDRSASEEVFFLLLTSLMCNYAKPTGKYLSIVGTYLIYPPHSRSWSDRTRFFLYFYSYFELIKLETI